MLREYFVVIIDLISDYCDDPFEYDTFEVENNILITTFEETRKNLIKIIEENKESLSGSLGAEVRVYYSGDRREALKDLYAIIETMEYDDINISVNEWRKN